jgi:pimeloyl-ACP methyl ester carboxylesterase
MMNRIVKDIGTIPGDVIDEFGRESRRPSAGDAYAQYNKRAIGPLSMRNWLIPSVGQIDIPALIVHGADDPLVDPRGSQDAARLMPQATLIVVPECGHWAQLEAHDRVLAEVRTFLADLRL